MTPPATAHHPLFRGSHLVRDSAIDARSRSDDGTSPVLAAADDTGGPGRRGEPITQEVVERALPASSGAPQLARQLARRACRMWGLSHACDGVVLAVSELVGNAVRHGARGQVRLRLARTPRRLRVEVADTAGGQPWQRCPSADEEGGRGLLLVAAVSARWGIQPEPVGKTVWVEFPLPTG